MSRESYWREDPTGLLRVDPGFVLLESPTDATPGFDGNKKAGRAALKEGALVLTDLQEKLFAHHQAGDDGRRILLVLQAMDTAGKGGIVKHVIGNVDPQGVQLASFKAPSEEEQKHDFLWRIRKQVPEAGMMGVFDRSHYEDVLIALVRELATPEEIERRYGAINEFEAELVTQGTTIIKVMLHISPEEQKKRLMDRMQRPEKQWKYSQNDVEERMLGPKYQEAYQAAFDRTATPIAPWYVVPADHKWYARLAVQHLLVQALEALELEWPLPDYDVETEKLRLLAS